MAQLHNSMQNAQVHWEEVGTFWRDSVRDQFEEELWLPLEERVAAVLKALNRLSQVLSRMEQDLGTR